MMPSLIVSLCYYAARTADTIVLR